MLKKIRSPRVFEALLNTTEEKNSTPYWEKAIQRYDYSSHDTFSMDHELLSADEVIRIDLIIGYEVTHDIEPEGEFTPSDHEVNLVQAMVVRIAVWIGEEEFMVPVTKKRSELILNKILD